MDDYSTPEERQIARRAAKVEKERLAVEDAVVQGIMATPGGRAWMHRYLVSCAVFQRTFDPNPHFTAFNEGRRSIGLSLLDDVMRASPDMYIQMMREQENGGRTDDLDREADDE